MDWLFTLVLALVVLCAPLVLAATSIRIVPFHQRLIVERFGRFNAVLGPGLVLLVPFVDRATVVNLDSRLPDWRTMTAREVAERLAPRHPDQLIAPPQPSTPRPPQTMMESPGFAPVAALADTPPRDVERDARELVRAGRVDDAVKLLRNAGHGLRDARRRVEEMGKA